MNEDRPEMEVIPTSKDLVAQYLLLYSFSGDPDDFDEIVDYDYQHANVAVYMRTDSTRDVTHRSGEAESAARIVESVFRRALLKSSDSKISLSSCTTGAPAWAPLRHAQRKQH